MFGYALDATGDIILIWQTNSARRERVMAELKRYVRDELYRNDEVYRADEVDALIDSCRKVEEENARLKEKDRREYGSAISAGWSEADAHYMPQIEQLQRDLDAAYAALWDVTAFYDTIDESLWRTENEAILKKAHDAIIQKAKEG